MRFGFNRQLILLTKLLRLSQAEFASGYERSLKCAPLSGLPPGPPNQLPRPSTTMSAPSTPSMPSTTNIVPTCSLPTTPSASSATGSSGVAPPSGTVGEHTQTASDQNRSPLSQGNAESYRLLLCSDGSVLSAVSLLQNRARVYIYLESQSVARTAPTHATPRTIFTHS